MNIEELAFKGRRTLAQLNENDLLDIIEFLQFDRINQFAQAHNESVKIQKENKQLQERIEYLERSNNRREDTIIEQRQEISDLEDNWDRLKEWVKEQPIFNYLAPVDIKNKMQELEQGSDE